MASAFGDTMNSSLENALNIGAGKANSAVTTMNNGLNAVIALLICKRVDRGNTAEKNSR